jgi:CheY-like chemotaxis protein
MGGDIDATSVLGAGSNFVIRVPVEVVEAPVPSPDRNDSEEKPDEFTGNTVLVIDDDPDARELMVRNLEPAGYEVRTADGMAAGMALARERRPIVILVDLLMPMGSGWEVLSRLKADPKLATIPVVVVTVVNQRPRGLSFGAAEHVTKPVDWNKLLKIVGRYRRDARQVNLPTVKARDLHE